MGYWGHKFDLSGSHDVIDHDSILHRPISIGGPWQGRSQGGGQRGAVPPAKPTGPPANFDRVISTIAYKRVWSL